METTLNLAWAALAVWMIWSWLRHGPRESAVSRPPERRVQLVALGLAILILLPAISLTDDLRAARNPAEVDTYLRRDRDWMHPHVLIPAAIALVVTLFAGLSLGATEVVARTAPAPATSRPALAPIQNRPPPAA